MSISEHERTKLIRFSGLAFAAADLSKDRSTKIGAAILGKGFEVKALGFNGFARGVDDDVSERHERPTKYAWTEHAERNAIYNAARAGTALEGSRLLLASPIFVCAECARGIIQAGISQVVWVRVHDTDSDRQNRWSINEAISREMLAEADIEVIELEQDPSI